MPALTGRAGVCAALLALAFAGCGGGDEGTPAVSSATPAGEGGTLVWAVAGPISGTDPLEASTRAEEILTRQVNEPLTAKVSGPFDVERRVPGLAVKAQSSEGDTHLDLHHSRRRHLPGRDTVQRGGGPGQRDSLAYDGRRPRALARPHLGGRAVAGRREVRPRRAGPRLSEALGGAAAGDRLAGRARAILG